MSQHHRASKALDQFTAEVAKQAQRNLAGSPSASTLATRLAIEQINHKAARALNKQLERNAATFTGLLDKAFEMLRAAPVDQLMVAALIHEEANAQASIRASINARAAINKRHDKQGGTREKANMVREAWATGKYPSRQRCAEMMAAKLGMGVSTAVRALNGTPDRKKP